MRNSQTIFTITAATLLLGTLFAFFPVASVMAESQPFHPLNTPPVARFTTDPASGGVVGTWFYFDPSATHDNEDSLAWLLIRYDWESDGVYDTIWMNPTDPQYRHQYSAPGAYTVRMEVKDRGNLTDTVEHEIVVGDPGSNTAPTARCVVTPTSGTVNTVFTFSAATSSDPQDATADLVARWDWHADGDYETAWLPATQTQTHKYDRHGLYEVNLEVRDTGTLSDNVICKVDVQPEQPNTSPTARFTVTPGQGDMATEFTFDPTASSDAENGIAWLQVQYDWTDDGVYDTVWINASQTMHYAFHTWGHLTVRMQVMDTGGLTDETTHTVDVAAANPLYLPMLRR